MDGSRRCDSEAAHKNDDGTVRNMLPQQPLVMEIESNPDVIYKDDDVYC